MMRAIITDNDIRFFKKRERLTRAWGLVGFLLLACLLSALIWMWFRVPNLVNPLFVSEQLRSGSIDPAILELSAVLLPVAMLMCFFITAVVIIYIFIAFSHERRYLRIINALFNGMLRTKRAKRKRLAHHPPAK